MLSKLQSRFLSQPRLPAQPAPSAKSSSQPRPGAPSTALSSKPLNTAVRTLQGESVFESSPAKLGKNPSLELHRLGGGGDEGGIGKVSSQQAAIEAALHANGHRVDFENTDGKTERVSVKEVPSEEGGTTYEVKVGDDTITVHFEEGTEVDHAAALAQIVDAFSETPPELRGGLEKVVVSARDGNGAAATALDGTITFYDNDRNLNADVFHHEMGHVIGAQLEDEGDSFWEDLGEVITGEESPPVPPGWDEAAEADGNHLNPYTRDEYNETGTYTEDFAEAWSEYMRAVDQGPEAVEQFERDYPERAKLLEEIYPPPA